MTVGWFTRDYQISILVTSLVEQIQRHKRANAAKSRDATSSRGGGPGRSGQIGESESGSLFPAATGFYNRTSFT